MATDEELLLAFRTQRDRAALQAFIERHQQDVFNIALHTLGDVGWAEDAVQETFLQMIRSVSTFRPGSAVRPWLCRVAVNAALKEIRTRKRRESREQQAHALRPPGGESMKILDVDTQAALRREVGNLPLDQRLPLTLHYFQGLSHQEIAQVLDCPAGTVASRVHGGLERLRKALAAAGAIVLVGTLEPALAAVTREPVPTSLAIQLARLARTAPLGAAAPAAKIAALVAAATAISVGGLLVVGGLSRVSPADPDIEIVVHTRPPSSVRGRGAQQVASAPQGPEGRDRQPKAEGGTGNGVPQDSPSSDVPSSDGPAVPAILGRVLAGPGRTPLPGTVVVVEQGRRQHRAIADGEGYYLFERLRPGPARIRILEKDGRLRGGLDLELSEGEFKPALDVFYSPEGSLDLAPPSSGGGKS
jgi:RNA polymerase sigma-70 factor (ECF subfamily)